MKTKSFLFHSFLLILLQLQASVASSYNEETTPSALAIESSSTTITAVKPSPSTPSTTPKPGKKKGGTDCPNDCSCLQDKILCEGKKLKAMINFSKFTASEIRLSNNQIEQLDFNLLPIATLEVFDLSNNYIKSFSGKNNTQLNKLKVLNISNNRLENLTTLSNIKLPALEVLDLSQNPLKEVSNFSNVKSLQTLDISSTKLKSIDLVPLSQLKFLNMSNIGPELFIQGNLFSNNSKIETLDISNNSLIEVPVSLRSTTAIATLILSRNDMTSIRESDLLKRENLVNLYISYCNKLTKIDELAFSHLNNLKNLILSNNPKLYHISKDAFESESARHELELIDISGNNITKLYDILQFPSLTFKTITLKDNPWQCDCDLKWMQALPLKMRSPVHCKSPKQVKDMEIENVTSFEDCDLEESGYHTIILTGFLLFLFGLLVAVYVQKSELCRRFLWKDQYGTIYYTKASFPPETV